MKTILVRCINIIGLVAVLGLVIPECGRAAEEHTAMKIQSTAFTPNGPIPARHSCEGANLSPALGWSDAPSDTRSFALIVDDPDAPVGIWVHWVAYNIPAGAEALAQGIAPERELADGMRQGTNDFKMIGYGGPCPPHGHGKHHYVFKLYALDTVLDLKPGATKAELEVAIQHHVLGYGELVGTYERK